MNNYRFSTIAEIHEAYLNGDLTVTALTETYLKAIADNNDLHAVMEVTPDALFIAAQMDEDLLAYRSENGPLPSLFGIPILLKDNINTEDKLHTSAGSLALKELYASYDATIVDNLRGEGALILGKANLTEFANYISDHMPNGFSAKGGQTVNPYNAASTTGGSSSGSGVSVAAGLCTVAVGTETCGSILSPSTQNGLYGIKPTMGRVSRYGIIPISSTCDIAGPMARCVDDAAILLNALISQDNDDTCTLSEKNQPVNNPTTEEALTSLQGLRICINRGFDFYKETPQEKIDAFNKMVDILKTQGAIISEIEGPGHCREIYTIMKKEFQGCMNTYLDTVRDKTDIHTMQDILDFNMAHEAQAIPYGQAIMLDAVENCTGLQTDPVYLEAMIGRNQMIRTLDKAFAEDYDLMLTPSFNTLAPYAGFPSLAAPLGLTNDGTPFASYWMAGRYEEEKLLCIGKALEQLLGLCLRPNVK